MTQRITVAEDRPPVADFSTVTSVTRDPSGTAYIILNDHSYSPDSDIISQRKWTVRYDSNNNGSFDDETAVVIDNGNSDTIRYETGDVGKYLFELEVKETFGQPAISRFVTESDYMIGNTSAKPHSEKCVEVINIAPVSSFSVAEKSKVDIVVNIENTSHSNSYIQAKINSILIPKLLANNIECCLVVKENRGKEEYNPVYDYVYYMRYIFYTDSNDEEIPVEFRFYKYNIYTGENTLIAYYDLEDFPYDYEYAEMCVIPDGSIYFSNTTNRELVRYKSGFTPVVSWFGAYNYFVRCNKEGLVFHDTYSGISVYNPYTGEDNHLSIREGGDAGNNGKYYGVYSTGGYGSTPYTYYFQEAHPNQENKNILSDCANISVIKASPNGNIYFQENTFESIYEYNPATEAIREALQLESSGGISLVGCGFKNTLYLMDVKKSHVKSVQHGYGRGKRCYRI